MRFLSSIVMLLTFLPTALMAEADNPPKPVGDLNILDVIAPLLIVVALIFALAWVVKKLNHRLPSIGSEIEILSSTPVSNQSRLCLIRIGGEDMLIGITNNNISLLKDFDEPVANTSSRPATVDFSQQFRNLLNKRSKSNGNS